MITFLEFPGLSPDEKNREILKCLSLLVPLGEDFSGLKNSINSAVAKVSKLGKIVADLNRSGEILASKVISFNDAEFGQYEDITNIEMWDSL